MPNVVRRCMFAVVSLVVVAGCLFGCSREVGPRQRLVPLPVRVSVSFDSKEVYSDSLLTASFVWETGKSFVAPKERLWVFLHFKDKEGRMLWQADHLPEPVTPHWRASQLIRYARTIYVPPIVSERRAYVYVGLYDPRSSKTKYLVSGGTASSQRPWDVMVGEVLVRPRPSLIEGPSWANVVFEEGFYAVEQEGNESWRWTGREASARLEYVGERGVLFVQGEVNLKCLKRVPTISLWVGGKLRVRFTPNGETGEFERKLIVEPDEFGDSRWLRLRLETSETFVPATCVSSSDTRELGLKIRKIYFGPSSP